MPTQPPRLPTHSVELRRGQQKDHTPLSKTVLENLLCVFVSGLVFDFFYRLRCNELDRHVHDWMMTVWYRYIECGTNLESMRRSRRSVRQQFENIKSKYITKQLIFPNDTNPRKENTINAREPGRCGICQSLRSCLACSYCDDRRQQQRQRDWPAAKESLPAMKSYTQPWSAKDVSKTSRQCELTQASS